MAEIERSAFGAFVTADWPVGTSAVVIGTCTGTAGIVPRELCLPHQVYTDKVRNLARKYDAREVVLIPVNSETYESLSREAVDALPLE